MMNETTITMSDWSEDENQFASIIIKMIKDRHAKYEKESVPVLLANMSLKSQDFFDYTLMMSGLSVVQGKNPNQNWNQNWKCLRSLL